MKKLKDLKILLFIIIWALLFFIIGTVSAKADLVLNLTSSPMYSFMPQNIWHNTIYNRTYSGSNNNSNVDKCKTPSSVRKIIVKKSNKKNVLAQVQIMYLFQP